ncbi:MAG: hypothetical protein GX335_07870 [Firmicutes bacterium]|nr:hypothetical protein [Bacillota bacterium]
MNECNRYGFDALKHGFRSDRGKSRKMTPQLKRPILENPYKRQHNLRPANLSRSTLYRDLANQPTLRGLGGAKGGETKCFAHKFNNELRQTDARNGRK